MNLASQTENTVERVVYGKKLFLFKKEVRVIHENSYNRRKKG